MADFDFVDTRVATGGAINGPPDVDQLVAAGITAVIDCRGEEDDARLLSSHLQIAYCYLGVPDDGLPKPASWFNAGIVFGLRILAQPRTKLYCHCAAGINRGPSMAYAILRATGLTPLQAETMMRAARPQVGLAYKTDADAAIRTLGYE